MAKLINGNNTQQLSQISKDLVKGSLYNRPQATPNNLLKQNLYNRPSETGGLEAIGAIIERMYGGES